jgi:hypothetical protein
MFLHNRKGYNKMLLALEPLIGWVLLQASHSSTFSKKKNAISEEKII